MSKRRSMQLILRSYNPESLNYTIFFILSQSAVWHQGLSGAPSTSNRGSYVCSWSIREGMTKTRQGWRIITKMDCWLPLKLFAQDKMSRRYLHGATDFKTSHCSKRIWIPLLETSAVISRRCLVFITACWSMHHWHLYDRYGKVRWAWFRQQEIHQS